MTTLSSELQHATWEMLRRARAVLLPAMLLHAITAHALLNGTFTIGGAGANYPTIDSALAALSGGINGPVTFRINGGAYIPPAGGYVLRAITGMSATNTVTFKPALNAVVIIQGSLSVPIIDIDHGDFYTLDGSNTTSGTSRDWQIINSGTGSAVQFINGATGNTVKNMVLICNSNATTTGIIKIGTSTISGGIGNSNNVIAHNTIGDSSGSTRSRVGIYARGSVGHDNVENIIDGNDIINYARGSGSGYGIAIATNNRNIKILRNIIRMTNITGINSLDICYGIHYSDDAGQADTIAYNRIWDLNTEKSTTELNGIYISTAGNAPVSIFDNMVTLVANGGTLNGLYIDAGTGSPVCIEHNSVHIGGTATRRTISNNLRLSGTAPTIRNNVFSNVRTSAGDTTNLLISANTTGFISDHNLFSTGLTGNAIGSFNGSIHAGLDAWRGGSGGDGNSVSGYVTFTDVGGGDLHVNSREVFSGESIGMASGVRDDHDGETRANPPDAGADEGDFNGAALAVIVPNAGDTCIVNYPAPVRFSAKRPMTVNVQISLDGGSTWIDRGTISAVAGINAVPVMMPDTETSRALVRVVSIRNRFEADTSDAPFMILRPALSLLSPNGGELLVPGDTARISWSSTAIPSNVKLMLDYSTDGGLSWRAIATGLPSLNLPSTNAARWIVPDLVTEQAVVRATIVGGTQMDRSDKFFTILPRPRVTITRPVPGGALFAGETATIQWTSITTDYVRLQYSIDNGATWLNVVAGGGALPAYFGEFPWQIPDMADGNALLRIIDDERPRYADTISASFPILRSEIRIASPNGGEKFEPGMPVTVRWNARNATMLRLEYSADGGKSWELVADHITASAGRHAFVPTMMPTRQALVRLTNPDRPRISDLSDAPFEIMAATSITLYTPAAGDRFARGSTTVISWDAPHIDRVDILFSPDDGETWNTLAADIPSIDGAFVWTLPDSNTTHGKIRVREAGTTLHGETGIFEIHDPAGPSVTVIAPNGGESYMEGSTVPIRWSANGLTEITIAYSADDGATWTDIQANVPAAKGQILWTAPNMPGMAYRVRIVSTAPMISGMSKHPFAITRRATPAITILAPNGGEKLEVGGTTEVRWKAMDITAGMNVEYSTDSGTTWTNAATMLATGDGIYRFNWTVPSAPTTRALMRVTSPDAGDISDSVFEIVPMSGGRITVISPNGGEIFRSNEEKPITWGAPPDIIAVDIDYSLDGGAHWLPVMKNIASTATGGRHAWRVPLVVARTTTALIRVRNHADTTRSDISDTTFTIEVASAGIANAAVADSGTRSLGAFPNPFSETTELRWNQETRAGVALNLYDGNGRLVRSLDLGDREAGIQYYMIDGEGLVSGLYIYELRIGTAVARGTITAIR
ncbi:MAG: hypothetical protein JWQ98_1343 [Chlorobi bacterium]|nr:hypothetical protein [Chlorobiota bacterium]